MKTYEVTVPVTLRVSAGNAEWALYYARREAQDMARLYRTQFAHFGAAWAAWDAIPVEVKEVGGEDGKEEA